MQNQPVLQLLSVIIAGIFGAVFTKFLEEFRQRRSLSHALAGEIEAILNVIRHRGYIAGLDEAINKIETTGESWSFRVRVEQNYFSVYERNADRIGLLRNGAASDVAHFYTYLKSLIEDLTDTREMRSDAKQQLQYLKRMKAIFDLMSKKGEAAITNLKKH